jgi:putative FmdB family regulatory protein
MMAVAFLAHLRTTMPFYEYECSNCKFYVEALQKISDAPLKQCPSCKKQTLKKLVSAPVFRLKGDGWYETDFKSEEEKKRNLADREEAAESKPEEPKEAKPEAKEAKGKDAKPAAAKPAGAAKGKAKPKAKPAAKTPARAAPAKAKPRAKVKPVAKKKK